MLPSRLTFFLYPIGLVANLFFGSAFLIQWHASARIQKTLVPKLFWILSSVGAVLMIIHSVIQSQLPVTLLYALNLAIYLRNLNVNSTYRLSLFSTLAMLFAIIIAAITPFLIGAYFNLTISWMASPNIFALSLSPPGVYWKTIGCLGLAIFSLRFFIQWCYLEMSQTSTLPKLFWRVGLLGGSLALAYFVRTGDLVNILSYGCGIFPALANLRIIKKKAAKEFSQSVFLSVGESSGDLLGADLIRVLKHIAPTTTFFGTAGPQMRAEGIRTLLPMEVFQISGFFEVLISLGSLIKYYRILYKAILQENPKCVVCIDFPDFHLFLIKKLRKKGYKGKVIHYVCPSIWAWRPRRKRILETYLDVLLLILPFEKQLFSDSTLKTYYLGHPLTKAISSFEAPQQWKESLNIPDLPIIAAFPGSRESDIVRNLNLQVRAFLASSFASTHQLLVSSSDQRYDVLILEILRKNRCPQGHIVPSSLRYALMRDCTCALAKCGTIVLEAALNKTPTIVTCLLRPLDVFLAKYVFRIFLKSYSLPNLIMRSVVFPEFIGGMHEFSADEVASSLDLLAFPDIRAAQIGACEKLYKLISQGAVRLEDALRDFDFL